MGKIDHTHAASPQQAVQHIGANLPAGPFKAIAGLPLRYQRGCPLFFFLTGIQQQAHIGSQTPILAALRVDQLRSRIVRKRQGLVKNGLDALKSICLGIHGNELLARKMRATSDCVKRP